MDTQDQARALMMRHHKLIKNRQQSMLNRVADEVGTEPCDCTMVQGKPNSNATNNYERSNATMS